LFASDPPYLVDYDGTNHPSKQGAADKNKDWGNSYGITWDDSSQGPELYEGFIKAAIEHAILPNAAWYCWHASRRQAMVESVWEKHGAFVHQQIVWAKDRGILTRSYYLWQHEPCFFGWIKGNKPPRVSEDYPSTVWPLPTVKVGEKTDHPTSKPVDVFAIPMRQHARPGEVCYEPFSGSGSQIIAGETTGRRVFAIEISPQYVDVAVKRWQTAAGKRAILDGDGRTFDEVTGERLPKAA
jgi:DNA modification methylase